MSALGWDLEIKLPEQWFMLPVGPDAELDDLEGQLASRIELEPELAPARHELRAVLLAFAEGATERGAASSALRWALDELDEVSTATLDTYVMQREPGPVDDTVEQLRRDVGARQPTDRDEPLVEVRRLAAGPALRLQVITETRSDERPADGARSDDEPMGILLVETVQYWLPIPDHADLAMLAFATPNIAGAESLIAELDEAMEAIELIR